MVDFSGVSGIGNASLGLSELDNGSSDALPTETAPSALDTLVLTARNGDPVASGNAYAKLDEIHYGDQAKTNALVHGLDTPAKLNSTDGFGAVQPDGSIKMTGHKAAAQVSHESGVLGALSTRYESSGRGPGTVSSGHGDRGGISYGSYQLASHVGSLQKFLISTEFKPYAAQFVGLKPNSREFIAKWKLLAKIDPKGFQAVQHAYTQRRYYQAAVDKVKIATSFDISQQSKTIKDVVWSTSVQHGTAPELISKAIRETDATMKRTGPTYSAALIKNIYKERVALVAHLRDHTHSADERENYKNILLNRYPNELRDALNSL